MWLLGCIIFNMVTGVPPYFLTDMDKNDSDIFAQIRAGLWREKLDQYHENAGTNLI